MQIKCASAFPLCGNGCTDPCCLTARTQDTNCAELKTGHYTVGDPVEAWQVVVRVVGGTWIKIKTEAKCSFSDRRESKYPDLNEASDAPLKLGSVKKLDRTLVSSKLFTGKHVFQQICGLLRFLVLAAQHNVCTLLPSVENIGSKVCGC